MRKKIVIVGGGFAGVNVLKRLVKHQEFEITLVDKNNYNYFTPLIYQVATGFIEPSSISYPFRSLLSGKPHAHFWLGKLQEVIPEENKIKPELFNFFIFSIKLCFLLCFSLITLLFLIITFT